MKKSLLSFLMLFVALVTFAGDINIDFYETKWTTSPDASSISYNASGFDFLGKKNTGASNPAFNEPSNDVRIYAKGTFSISSDSYNMTSVSFVISTQGKKRLATITASTGTVAMNKADASVVWTGDAKNVVFTVGDKADYGTEGSSKAGQLCFTALNITATGGETTKVETPTIDINAGTYFETQKVTLECATADAKIYYTTDGTEPSTASTEYTAPIEVASSMTIKAIAAKGTELSSVLTAAYEIVTPENVATIAEFLAKEDGSIVKFSTPLTVVKHHEARLFVTDGVDYTLIYGTITAQYEQGQAIPAGAIGYKTTYNGLLELEKPVDASFGKAIESTISLTPIAVNISEITEDRKSVV